MNPRSRVADAAPRRKRSASEPAGPAALETGAVPDAVLAELIQRVSEIESNYREVAQKMGRLYMYADQHDLAMLNRHLDRPMRNASDNERAMVSILDELQRTASRRQPGKN